MLISLRLFVRISRDHIQIYKHTAGTSLLGVLV